MAETTATRGRRFGLGHPATLARRRVEPVERPAAHDDLSRWLELGCGAELAPIRTCADPGCSLLLTDRSRGGRPPWYSMELCGDRAETARCRQRRRASQRTGRRRR
ncbi:MAG TPA: CGNR zinc finger domain-containing protein [Gaiellaceae bacterium]|nr:CGNR zinc finger domain-containing protein [Gaiellaceae bacterium]